MTEFSSLLSGLHGLNPGFVMILGGVLVAALRGSQAADLARAVVLIGAPILAMLVLLGTDLGAPPVVVSLPGLGLELIPFRADPITFPFALAFLIAGVLNGIYSLHIKDRVQDAAGLIYSGAAVAAVFAGDFITLFLFWELTAIASVFLIWANPTPQAYKAGLRYLVIQIFSGVVLLAGAAMFAQGTGSLAFGYVGLDSPGGWLILLAFGIKAAFPLLHNWLQDAYPQATHTGTVILSAYTTKLAVYALLRGFPGEDMLIWVGAIMTVFPLFFAVMENDLRKVLSYSLNNQVGFMVCAVGVGTELALNGAAAHAFAHIIYKALLFMTMGAVLFRVGTTEASKLGGLHRTMPFTTICCIIGAISISGFPLFSGFVAKSMTMSAVQYEHLYIIWIMLLFASVGVLEHSGIKIPFFTFFGHDSGLRPKEAPFNMALAMGLAAFICIILGLMPYQLLYPLLPYREVAAGYQVYSFDHINKQMQSLTLAAFAFALLKQFKLYPDERPGVILDSDWFYRRPGHDIFVWTGAVLSRLASGLGEFAGRTADTAGRGLTAMFAPNGIASRVGLVASMGAWAVAMLGLVLLLALAANVWQF
jgi:multicomponent Na+:H+ antiporter subunit D